MAGLLVLISVNQYLRSFFFCPQKLFIANWGYCSPWFPVISKTSSLKRGRERKKKLVPLQGIVFAKIAFESNNVWITMYVDYRVIWSAVHECVCVCEGDALTFVCTVLFLFGFSRLKFTEKMRCTFITLVMKKGSSLDLKTLISVLWDM